MTDTQRQSNIEMAQSWMDNLFVYSDFDSARSALHEEFTFTYMGITQNVGGIAHSTVSFSENHIPLVGDLLPKGIVLTTADVIADENGVALIMVGDAEGINGRYDNQYVFTFKFKDGLIHAAKEYNSDLLVGTRLYKNKLEPIG